MSTLTEAIREQLMASNPEYQRLREEHALILKVLDCFEIALGRARRDGVDAHVWREIAGDLLRLFPLQAGVDPKFREDKGPVMESVFEEFWNEELQGTWKRFKPLFLKTSVEVKTLEQNFRNIQLRELRENLTGRRVDQHVVGRAPGGVVRQVGQRHAFRLCQQ